MSDIAKFSPAAGGVGFAGGAAAFKKAAPTVKAGGIDLLKLRKGDGVWVYGKDDIEVEEGAQLTVDANALAMGFVDWKGGRPVGERMAVVGTAPINPADLPPAQGAKGWEDQVALGMIITSGEDEGQMVLYKTNAMGGIEAFNDLFDAMMARAAASKPFNPVISLSESNYNHSEYGKIYKPIFTVVGWTGEPAPAIPDDQDVAEEAAEAEPVEAPKKRRQRRA